MDMLDVSRETVDDDGVIRVSPSPVFLRTAYNYSMDAASDESALYCEDGTRAQQQFKEECDINTIVERFGLTGELPVDQRVPLNEEFVEAMDFKTAHNLMIEAEAAFMAFPANVRERFQNDATKFVDFASDSANIEQMREWGMAMPKKEEAGPLLVKIAPEAAPDQ